MSTAAPHGAPSDPFRLFFPLGIVLGVAGVQRLRHRQVHDGVPKELEALVVTGSGVRVLVEPAGMDERLLEQVEIADGEAESFPDDLSRTHRETGR